MGANRTGSIHSSLQLSGELVQAMLECIIQSHLVRQTMVRMYLSMQGVTGQAWCTMVTRMGRYMEEAGTAVYSQIRDRLVEPGAAPLACKIFARDLRNVDQSLDMALQLGVLAPFVRFLELPEASYFEAGRFTCLVPFLRGHFSVIEPGANELRVNQAHRCARLMRLGKYWAQMSVASVNTSSAKYLGIDPKDDRAILQLAQMSLNVSEDEQRGGGSG
ncbi:unnamed protein product [Merluccius merluccius]